MIVMDVEYYRVIVVYDCVYFVYVYLCICVYMCAHVCVFVCMCVHVWVYFFCLCVYPVNAIKFAKAPRGIRSGE